MALGLHPITTSDVEVFLCLSTSRGVEGFFSTKNVGGVRLKKETGLAE
jgi:hypothetical protein